MALDDDIRVMIIDDREAVRRGIAEAVDRMNGLIVVAEAGSVQEAIRRGEFVHPDAAPVDLRLPDGTGIDIIRCLTEAVPDTKCIVLMSFDDDRALVEAQAAGAKAYLLKSVRGAEIMENTKAVASGKVLLDERAVPRRRADHVNLTADLMPSERRVFELIDDGFSNRKIGDHSGIAEETVKNHITSLLSEMGLQRHMQVAVWVAGQRVASWRHGSQPGVQRHCACLVRGDRP